MKDSLLRTVLLALLGSVSLMPLLVLPVMVGGFVDYLGMTQSGAGWAASAGFLGSATGAILVALRIHHLDLRKIALAGLIVMIICDTASMIAASLPGWLFLVLRFGTGVGSAAVFAAVMTTYARRCEPDRAYGLFMAMTFAFSALGLYTLPSIMPALGITGLFVVFTLLDLIALGLLPRLPYRHERLGRVPGAPMEWRVLTARTSVACLFGFGMFEAYNMANYTYVERIGRSIGLEGGEIGLALGVSTIFGIPGGFGVTWLGARFGHFKPIAVAISVQAFALLGLLYGTGMLSYFIALCLMGFAWGFSLPYFYAIEAEIDRGGTVVVAGGFATGFAGFIGPATAASLVSPGDYSTLILSCVTVCLAVILLMRYVTARVTLAGA